MKKLLIYILAFAILPVLSSCSNFSHKKKSEKNKSVLLSNPLRKASCVFLTDDNKNSPIVSWVEIDNMGKKFFFFSKLDTASEKFSSPISIPIEQNASIHEEGMPKIAIKGDGSLFALYETSVTSKNSRWGLGDIHYIQSFDGGKSWTSPKSVAPEEIDKGLSCNFSGLTRLPDGEIGITWLGTSPHSMRMKKHPMPNMAHAMGEHEMHEEGRPVEFAKTVDKNGMDQSILIDSSACQCCRTAVSSSKDGRISIVYRDLLPGSIRDISVSISTDNGNTFSRPASFSNDHWVVNGCPHDGPAVAVRNDNTYVTWFTGSKKDKGVNYAELDSSGNVLIKNHISANGRFIQLCLLPDGTRVTAYNKSYLKGDSMFSKIIVDKINGKISFEKEVTPPHVHASYPVVEAAGNNHVIVAWSGRDRVYYRIIDVKNINSPVEEIGKLGF